MIESQQDRHIQQSGKQIRNNKKSNLHSLLPPIQMPTIKRSVLGFQQKQRNFHKIQTIQEQIKEARGDQKLTVRMRGQKFSIFKMLQTKKVLTTFEISTYRKVAQILSYIYNEFEFDQRIQGNRNSIKQNVYKDWELQQIKQNYNDTNLGDFIIKMVNPDLLPEDYMDKYGDDKRIPLKNAQKIYDKIFNIEQTLDKNLQNCQAQAFRIAFKLSQQLGVKSHQKVTPELKQKLIVFTQVYKYFERIQPLFYGQYLDVLKSPDFNEKETFAKCPQIQLFFREFVTQTQKSQKNQVQNYFTGYKVNIYNYLSANLINSKEYQFKRLVIKHVKSISKFLYIFPELIAILKNYIDENNDTLKFSGGGYLSRQSHEGQLKWISKNIRPPDLLTLLRKFLLYKLTQRGGLFVRTFLSKSENYIYLTIKASEQHLQKMAQQSNFNMQIQMGSIDIFSFEPVDKYARPLRCNKYIRDIGFIKKYNLQMDKKDKDQNLGSKSIQSQALNIYNKAIKMNKQQLRAKIILDQQESDSCLSWLSNKLRIRFVHHSQILNNSQNQQQVQQDLWPVYYIYNKIIIQYITRLRDQFKGAKGNKPLVEQLTNNIGLTLRLMFLKALNFCNDMYRDHRDAYFRGFKNLFLKKYPLQTIWNQMGENSPRGYHPYFYSAKLQKIWRKYQINQEKERSKFSPSARLIITNKIIREHINISKSLTSNLLVDFYPIHDPFILKNIKLRPYLNVLNNMLTTHAQTSRNQQGKLKMSQAFVEFQCDYTIQDFTKQSLQDKLAYKCQTTIDFSVNSVAFYCGEKLAFFFQFRRYLSQFAWPLIIPTFIIQIIFWAENSDIARVGSSSLTQFNTILMIILVLINTIWVEYVVTGWESHQEKLARSYGTNDLNDQSQVNKRVLFEGEMKRNLQTNQLNDQHQNRISAVIKQIITFLINVVFVVLVGSSILIVFVLKTILIQQGYSQSIVSNVPSISISLLTQIYSFIYKKISGILVQFENKKTIQQYQGSLTYKSFLVTFVITYFALFIYIFFQQYFQNKTTCSLITSEGISVYNCYYYISGQLVTQALTDLVLMIVMAFVPLIQFYVTQGLAENKIPCLSSEKGQNQEVSYNLNYFEAIDNFYEEQDRMVTYMYNDQIDRCWEDYTATAISFTTLCLFAPFVPFLYVMMYVAGVVFLNAKKYQIIYFSKRTIPLKVKSVGIWLTIIRIVSVIGVFVNIALVVYIRDFSAETDRSIIYFSCVFVILILKYLMSFRSKTQDEVGKRCKLKIEEMMTQKSNINFDVKNDLINTDIQNVYYDQKKLGRKFPSLKGANIKYQ